MAKSTVKITDKRFREAEREIIKQADKALRTSAFAVEAMAKIQAPWRTGNLRNSIQTRFPIPGTAIISANAHYAIYVEMGTRFMAAQPFLIPSFEKGKRQLMALLSKLVIRL